MRNTLGISTIIVVVILVLFCAAWIRNDNLVFSNAQKKEPTSKPPQVSKDGKKVKIGKDWLPFNSKAQAEQKKAAAYKKDGKWITIGSGSGSGSGSNKKSNYSGSNAIGRTNKEGKKIQVGNEWLPYNSKSQSKDGKQAAYKKDGKWITIGTGSNTSNYSGSNAIGRTNKEGNKIQVGNEWLPYNSKSQSKDGKQPAYQNKDGTWTTIGSGSSKSNYNSGSAIGRINNAGDKIQINGEWRPYNSYSQSKDGKQPAYQNKDGTWTTIGGTGSNTSNYGGGSTIGRINNAGDKIQINGEWRPFNSYSQSKDGKQPAYQNRDGTWTTIGTGSNMSKYSNVVTGGTNKDGSAIFIDGKWRRVNVDSQAKGDAARVLIDGKWRRLNIESLTSGKRPAYQDGNGKWIPINDPKGNMAKLSESGGSGGSGDKPAIGTINTYSQKMFGKEPAIFDGTKWTRIATVTKKDDNTVVITTKSGSTITQTTGGTTTVTTAGGNTTTGGNPTTTTTGGNPTTTTTGGNPTTTTTGGTSDPLTAGLNQRLGKNMTYDPNLAACAASNSAAGFPHVAWSAGNTCGGSGEVQCPNGLSGDACVQGLINSPAHMAIISRATSIGCGVGANGISTCITR